MQYLQSMQLLYLEYGFIFHIPKQFSSYFAKDLEGSRSSPDKKKDMLETTDYNNHNLYVVACTVWKQLQFDNKSPVSTIHFWMHMHHCFSQMSLFLIYDHLNNNKIRFYISETIKTMIKIWMLSENVGAPNQFVHYLTVFASEGHEKVHINFCKANSSGTGCWLVNKI